MELCLVATITKAALPAEEDVRERLGRPQHRSGITVNPHSPGADWSDVAAAFLDTADSANTRRAYKRWLRAAGEWMGVDTVAEVTGTRLLEFRRAVLDSDSQLLRLLADPRPGRRSSTALQPASHAQGIAALRAFLMWSRTMGAHQLPAEVVSAALKTPQARVQRPYSVLTEAEVAAILSAATTARDRALLGVMLGAGLRVSEVVALDVGDLLTDQEGGAALYVRQGKGRKDRVVPIQPEVERLLRAYLAITGRRLGQTGPLFRAHDRGLVHRGVQRGRLGAGAVWAVVQSCAVAAGINAKKVSPHALRHTWRCGRSATVGT